MKIALPPHLPLQVGYSTKADGNMSFPLANGADVFAHRSNFFAREGIPRERMVTFFTEHSDDVTRMLEFPAHLNAMRGERLAVTDVIITRLPNTGVFLTFGDCVPFIVYDQRQHLMAFAHIGWRSMAMGFTQKVLRTLVEEEGSHVQDLFAVIGPCIKKESYLFSDPIQAKEEIWQPFLVQHASGDGRLGIDLVGFCQSQCQEMGLAMSQLVVEPVDTFADANQFSHYAATAGGQPDKQGRLVCYGYLE